MDISEALAEQGVHTEVVSVSPLYGGACQENFRVVLKFGHNERVFAMRADAPSSLPGSIGRALEFEVAGAASGAGVPTPAVHWLLPGLLGEGRDAYLMDWVDGVAIGARVTRDPRLEAARKNLPEELARALASIHAIGPDTGLAFDNPQSAGSRDPVDAGLFLCEEMLQQLPEHRPAMRLILRWLDRNRPPCGDTVLVHGDFRTGNFLVEPTGLQAVLDWEFAHWGVREEDVAWFCVRDWRFGQLHKPAGGLTTRADFLARYTRASGVELDRDALHWWEILGNLSWGAGAVYQGERYLSGEVRDLELLAIARRAGEMEYEALRLITEGPQ